MKLKNTIICIAIAAAFTAPALAQTVKGGRVVAPRVADPAQVKPQAAGAKAAPKAPQAETVSLPAISAEAIVAKNIAARGGLAAWQGVKSMSMEGMLDAGKRKRDGGDVVNINTKRAKAERLAEARKVAMGQAEAKPDDTIQLPFAMEMQRPMQKRLEVPFQGQKAVQVYDGKNGWKLRPFLGRHEVEAFTATEAKAAAEQQELDGPLVDYAAKGTKVEVAGGEKVEGRNAYKLKLTLKNGDVRHLWLDAESFLDLKMEGAPRRMDGRMRTVETYFRDYRPLAGLMLPYVFETRVEGIALSERIVVERIALNPPLENSRFSKPE